MSTWKMMCERRAYEAIYTVFPCETSSMIVSHLLHISLIHKFGCVRTEPQFPLSNLLPSFAFVFFPFAVFLMYSLSLPSQSFGPPPLCTFPVCSSDRSTITWLRSLSCCWFYTKLFNSHTHIEPLIFPPLLVSLSTFLSLFVPKEWAVFHHQPLLCQHSNISHQVHVTTDEF